MKSATIPPEDNKKDSKLMNRSTRRSFLKQSSFLIGAGVLGRTALGQTTAKSIFVLANTASGKLQGMNLGGINTFKGIPYGAPTGGRNRFMPPQKAASWAGTRDAFEFGQISPQVLADSRAQYTQLIDWDLQSANMGEDCLALNIWTPGLKDGVKRPVMVSLHGGGFAIGSSAEPGYNGDTLARFADVVVVTVNHRLASLGYLNLADLGAPPEFAYAGIAGMMDIVAALEWIRDNIENFGGDPATVMVWGQSGGGAKTGTLMAMPSAKGLFHRAAVQSGSSLRLLTREAGASSAEKLLKQLNLDKSRIADIQKLSWEQILDAQTAVAGSGPGGPFSPVVDGKVLPRHPFDPDAPTVSADVPMIISTVLDEAALVLTNFDLDEAGLKKFVQGVAGDQADRVLKLYRSWYPTTSPYLIQARIITDRSFRSNAVKQAERKAALGKAPAYMYLFTWPAPGYDGKFGAVHGTDVGLVFHSYRGAIGGGGAVGQALADRMAATWVAFAKTGDPNNSSIPHWPIYHPESRATMVFDRTITVENDPRSEFRVLWEELGTGGFPG
jgi:para-nitrobenzyl esterase